MIPLKRGLQLAMLLLSTTLITSCVSDKPKPPEMPKEWWNNPGAVGKFAAIGRSKIIGTNVAGAQRRAEVQARATMAANLRAEIQSLTELWSQETGDMTNEASLKSMFNDETFTRQIVDTTLEGAKVDRYDQVKGDAVCLVVLEKQETFYENLVDEVEEQAIKDDTYFETEVKKSKARDLLDAQVGKQKADAEAERAARQAALGS